MSIPVYVSLQLIGRIPMCHSFSSSILGLSVHTVASDPRIDVDYESLGLEFT